MIPAMGRIWIRGTRCPDWLELNEAPYPEGGAGQVRMLARGSGIDFDDQLVRMGLCLDALKLCARWHWAIGRRAWPPAVRRRPVRRTPFPGSRPRPPELQLADPLDDGENLAEPAR